MMAFYEKPVEHLRGLMHSVAPLMRWDGVEPFTAWQSRARGKLKELLGLPYAACAEAFELEWHQEHETFIETRFRIQTEEGFYVPCHFCMPKGQPGPLPVALCLQGHTTGMHISLARAKYPKDEAYVTDGDRDLAICAMKEGFCCLIVEQRCFGELGSLPDGHPDCADAHHVALLLGRTIIGDRVWDMQRAIDALEAHFPQADVSRLLCVGQSAGGTTTIFLSCVEPRVRFSMPASAFCMFDDCIGDIRHCSCNYVPKLRNFFEASDLAGLIAPRPLVVIAGNADQIFPIEGVRKAFDSAKALYAAAGAAGNIRLAVGEGGHRFYADAGWTAMRPLL